MDEGVDGEALESNALSSVRHLVEALKMCPVQGRLQAGHEGLLKALVPASVHKIQHLLVEVLAERYIAQGQIAEALHVLEEALQMAPMIADTVTSSAPLTEFISSEEIQLIVRGMAQAETKLLQVCDEHLNGGWAAHADELRVEREEWPATWHSATTMQV